MAGIDVFVIVEDVTSKLLTYESIELHRSDTLGGAYSLVETETLVAGTFYYTINNADGDLNKWYKYRFHHDTGSVNSGFSNPFRPEGVTRLRGRQAALAKYGAGIVLVNTGTDSNKITTADYRVKTTLFRDDRGKGTWLWPTTGNNAEKARLISASVASTGVITVLPTWAGAFVDGDEIEWHTLADPTEWNNAMNRGLARYWYVERVPIVGVASQEEYSLVGIPFLKDKEHVHDVRWYPTSGVDVDESFGTDGRWWRIREDVGVLTLQIHPAIAATQTLYLETTRPMQSLYTDASAAPPNASEELVAALTYDEVLAYLSAPGRGSVDARATWRTARGLHASELHRLLIEHRPKPRQGRPQMPWPPKVPQPWGAR
ncbi:hypothetical protein LCGC14_0777720 [marine sediment metagenome]|uniref:Uncharacterized protein n=1 Tax=marine sediment metagenome TaxID=412755 RepID=A0A0F9T3H3_9ZZZZ